MSTDTLLATHAVTPRLDLYAGIHKALRSFMMDTLGRVGRIDTADTDDMEPTLEQLDALLTLCEKHLRHENDFVHTAIEARQPGASGRIADEHREHLESIAALRDEAQQLRRGGAGQRPAVALRLYRHLALFVAENFEHMHIEETVHNATLWAHYTDQELMALHGRLMASIPPQEVLDVMRWMLPALGPAERAGLLNGMKAQLPPHAFQALVGYVRPHLDDIAWVKLAPAIGVEPWMPLSAASRVA
ncbi:hypothetical protein [Piscinibacter sp. XHJ-5]|uniref:hemerythrin domain-containing protein n=1 Tax=Piscinibacter sp. XHJ-5 TaxID=3037797 RepID=UPI002452E181|nr:hypothetical protein [Piscinibacter sp. XHJ-5]